MPKKQKYCDAEFCENTARNCDLRFFSIPLDPERRQLWLANMELKETGRSAKYFCSDHFHMNAFTNTLKTRLLHFAVPSIQVPRKSMLLVGEIITAGKHCIRDGSETASMNKKRCLETKCSSSTGSDTIFSNCDSNSAFSKEKLEEKTVYSGNNEIHSVLNQLKERNAKEHSYKDLIRYSAKLLESSACLKKEDASSNKQAVTYTLSNYKLPQKLPVLCVSLGKKISKPKEKFLDYRAKVFELNKVLKEKEDKLESMKKILNANQKLCDSYSQQIDQIRTQLTNSTNEFELLNKKLSKLTAENCVLRKRNMILRSQMRQISFLRNYCTKLEKNLKRRKVVRKYFTISNNNRKRYFSDLSKNEVQNSPSQFSNNNQDKNNFLASLNLQEWQNSHHITSESSKRESASNLSSLNYVNRQLSVSVNSSPRTQNFTPKTVMNTGILKEPTSHQNTLPLSHSRLLRIIECFENVKSKRDVIENTVSTSCLKNIKLSNPVVNALKFKNSAADSTNNKFSLKISTHKRAVLYRETNASPILANEKLVVNVVNHLRKAEMQGNKIPENSMPSQSASVVQASSSSLNDVVCSDSVLPIKVNYKFKAHTEEANCVFWLPTLPVSLLTVGADKKVKHWEVYNSSIRSKGEYFSGISPILTVDVDVKTDLMALCCGTTCQVWDIRQFRTKCTLTEHRKKVMASKFIEPRHKVVSGSLDGTLKLWSVEKSECMATYECRLPVNDIECKNGNFVIGGHCDKVISFWDIRADSKLSEIATNGCVTSLNLSSDGILLLSSQRGAGLRIYDLRNFKEVSSLDADDFTVGCDWTRAKFSPDGQYCCCGSKNGSVFIWNVNTGLIERELIAHNLNVPSCSWSTCGSYFASCDNKGYCIIWDNS